MFLQALSFLLPFDQAIKAYKTSHLSLFYHKGKIVKKNSSQYHSLMQTVPGYHLKEKYKTFLNSNNIRQDLLIIEKSNNSQFCSGNGTNYFTKGEAYICMNPELS